jgi:hypothetical protein
MRDYSKYLKSGKRLAAFGKVVGDKLEIDIIVFSKKERFRKKDAILLYNIYLEWNYVCDIRIELPLDNHRPSWLFHKYMRENYYRKLERRTIKRAVLSEEVLYKKQDEIVLKTKITCLK